MLGFAYKGAAVGEMVFGKMLGKPIGALVGFVAYFSHELLKTIFSVFGTVKLYDSICDFVRKISAYSFAKLERDPNYGFSYSANDQYHGVYLPSKRVGKSTTLGFSSRIKTWRFDSGNDYFIHSDRFRDYVAFSKINDFSALFEYKSEKSADRHLQKSNEAIEGLYSSKMVEEGPGPLESLVWSVPRGLGNLIRGGTQNDVLLRERQAEREQLQAESRRILDEFRERIKDEAENLAPEVATRLGITALKLKPTDLLPAMNEHLQAIYDSDNDNGHGNIAHGMIHGGVFEFAYTCYLIIQHNLVDQKKNAHHPPSTHVNFQAHQKQLSVRLKIYSPQHQLK